VKHLCVGSCCCKWLLRTTGTGGALDTFNLPACKGRLNSSCRCKRGVDKDFYKPRSCHYVTVGAVLSQEPRFVIVLLLRPPSRARDRERGRWRPSEVAARMHAALHQVATDNRQLFCADSLRFPPCRPPARPQAHRQSHRQARGSQRAQAFRRTRARRPRQTQQHEAPSARRGHKRLVISIPTLGFWFSYGCPIDTAPQST
jgi:hypothetical protein